MDVTSKLVFSLVVVAWVAVVWLTDGRAILFLLENTTLFGDWRKDVATWIFFRDDESLRIPVLIAVYGSMIGFIWLV
jgi:hypothetical protein